MQLWNRNTHLVDPLSPHSQLDAADMRPRILLRVPPTWKSQFTETHREKLSPSLIKPNIHIHRPPPAPCSCPLLPSCLIKQDMCHRPASPTSPS